MYASAMLILNGFAALTIPYDLKNKGAMGDQPLTLISNLRIKRHHPFALAQQLRPNIQPRTFLRPASIGDITVYRDRKFLQ